MPPVFQPKKHFSKVAGALLLYLLVQFGLSFIMTPWIMTLNLDYETLIMFVNLMVSLVAGIIIVYYMKSSFKVDVAPSIKIDPIMILKGIGIVYFFNIVTGLFLYLFYFLGGHDTHPDIWLNNNMLYDVLTILTVVILAPIFEELIFRGMIYKYISKYDKMTALIVSSLLFGLLHMNITQTISTIFMGLAFGIVMMKTDNVVNCMIIHAINNTIALLSTYFVSSIWDILILALACYGGYVFIKGLLEKKYEHIDLNYLKNCFKSIPMWIYIVICISMIFVDLFSF